MCERRDVHQIVGDHPEADPAVYALDAMVATAAQAMATFEHTDAAFRADAPPLAATEPALVFIRAARRRFRASARQDHTSNATLDGGSFITSGCESPITGGQVRRSEAGAAGRWIFSISRPRCGASTMNSIVAELLKQGIEPTVDYDGIEANTYAYTSFTKGNE